MLAIADGVAGLLLWHLAPNALEAEGPQLGVDSRCAMRVPLPNGRRALCLAVRPQGAAAASAATAPLLACGCDAGTVVLLALGDAPAPTEEARVLHVGGRAEGVRQLAWSADGAWLYATVGCGVSALSFAV